MTAIAPSDVTELRTLGYRQELDRSIGSFGSFAAGFSFVSILTTVTQLFAFGYAFGGPQFFWTWPLVFGGQFLVALMFAELAGRFPVAGCIYQWATRLGGRIWGWFAGWTMLIAQVVTLAGAAIALQAALPAVWSGFQLVPGDSSVTSATGATNAAILGMGLLVVTSIINLSGVKLTAFLNTAGVTCELIGITVLVVTLLAHAERGPQVVLHPEPSGTSTMAGFIISSLMAAYVFVGFDSAGELSEETRNPRSTTPRTILRAVVASGIGGALMLLSTLMAAPSLSQDTLGVDGIAYVVMAQLGDVWGRLILLMIAISVSACTLAIQAATTRMFFSMSRDGVLPVSAHLRKVSSRTRTPIATAVLVGVLAATTLLVNMHSPALFVTLASVCIMLLYIAYLMVTTPLLYRRIVKHDWREGDPSGFSLGRWGLPVNIAAVLFGLGMVVNLGWPRAEVFDPEGGHWYLQWIAPLFLAATLLAGALAYAVQRWQGVSSLRAEIPHDLRAEGLEPETVDA